MVSTGASTTTNWTPSWEAQEENRSPRSIFILWWWGFNSIPGKPQPLNFSEQSTRHTHLTQSVLLTQTQHVLLPVLGSPSTHHRRPGEYPRKRSAVWMTDHPTVSNFSCTHKAKGEGGRGAVGAAAGDSEVVLTLCVPAGSFFGKNKQRSYKGQRPGQQQPSLSFSLWETITAWGSHAVMWFHIHSSGAFPVSKENTQAACQPRNLEKPPILLCPTPWAKQTS